MAKFRGAYLTWKASNAARPGVLRFDVVTSETFTSSSTATEFPVEQGANVSDHVRENLDKVSLEVFVSNTPIHEYDLVSTSGGKRGKMEAITLDIPPTKRGFGLSALLGRALDLLRGPKPNPKASVLVFDTAFIATFDTLEVLRQLKSEATLVDIGSRDWYAESMIIESISAPRTAAEGTGAKFTIEFKQIRIVETRQTLAPVPAEPRGKGIANGGAAGGKQYQSREPKGKSYLKSGKDMLAKAFSGGE